ncbi:hypothetical protein TWF281_001416 [Arthrobotrys megalospora]
MGHARATQKPDADIWELLRPRITELWLHNSLSYVVQTIKAETGFVASEKQCYRQLNEVWCVKKNLTKEELDYIQEIFKQRDAQGKSTRIKRYGVRVHLSDENVKRRKTRRFVSTLDRHTHKIKSEAAGDDKIKIEPPGEMDFQNLDVGTPTTVTETPRQSRAGSMMSLHSSRGNTPAIKHEASTAWVKEEDQKDIFHDNYAIERLDYPQISVKDLDRMFDYMDITPTPSRPSTPRPGLFVNSAVADSVGDTSASSTTTDRSPPAAEDRRDASWYIHYVCSDMELSEVGVLFDAFIRNVWGTPDVSFDNYLKFVRSCGKYQVRYQLEILSEDRWLTELSKLSLAFKIVGSDQKVIKAFRKLTLQDQIALNRGFATPSEVVVHDQLYLADLILPSAANLVLVHSYGFGWLPASLVALDWPCPW